MEREFLALNESERSVRAVMARLEAGVLRRFATLHHD
jgi:F-type H+-transporting ATPase subunit epsilon